MIPSLSTGPRTLSNDCNHVATASVWRPAISNCTISVTGKKTASLQCYRH